MTGTSVEEDVATEDVRRRLLMPITLVVTPGLEHMHVMAQLLESAGGGGDLVPREYLAPQAVESAATAHSHDADFARLLEVRWVNPVAG